jgi:hypothetical protein
LSLKRLRVYCTDYNLQSAELFSQTAPVEERPQFIVASGKVTLPRGLTRMADLKEAFTQLANSIIRSERQGHAAVVMRMTSILEYDLERSIKWEFRSLNKQMSDRLFGLYRPLSTFAAKIDIAYALEITTDDIHAELNIMRRIRNEFAHTKHSLSLDLDPIKTLFNKLKRPASITGSYLHQFVKCALVLDDHLEAFLVEMGETNDLRALAK